MKFKEYLEKEMLNEGAIEKISNFAYGNSNDSTQNLTKFKLMIQSLSASEKNELTKTFKDILKSKGVMIPAGGYFDVLVKTGIISKSDDVFKRVFK